VNRRSREKARGIILHSDTLDEDETCLRDGIRLTTPARTGFDLGRRKGLTTAVIRLDALMHATGLKVADVELLAERHSGMRGLVQLRQVSLMADGGAESPYETRTRLVLVGSGLPRPQTQIDAANPGHRSTGRTRGPGLDDHPGQRRLATTPTSRRRGAHP
jgi:hypothetical protein